MSDLPLFRPQWLNLKQPSSTDLHANESNKEVALPSPTSVNTKTQLDERTPPSLIAEYILADENDETALDLPDANDEEGRWEQILQEEEQEEELEEELADGVVLSRSTNLSEPAYEEGKYTPVATYSGQL